MRRGACLLIAAVAVAGCGGSGDGRLSKGEYEAKLRAAFAAAHAELDPRPGAAGSIALLTRIRDAYSDVATALEGLYVPANVQVLNDRLGAAAAARAATLKRLVGRLGPASADERKRLLAEYDTSQLGTDDFDAAVDALTAKGYEFRPSAGT
jgi:hypothetical protein